MSPRAPRPITAGDIDQLQDLTADLGAPFFELCESNLYLFRDIHAYRLGFQDAPYLEGVTFDGVRHSAPLTRLDFEQDLGKPGFRQAKRARGPTALLHRHRLRPLVHAAHPPE